MATIETSYDQEKDLRVFAVAGTVSADEVIERIESFFEEESPARLVLWDFRDADLREVASDDVGRVVMATMKHAGRRLRGRTAMVFASDLSFGLGRMFDLQRGPEDQADVKTRAFRDMEEALDWLGDS